MSSRHTEARAPHPLVQRSQVSGTMIQPELPTGTKGRMQGWMLPLSQENITRLLPPPLTPRGTSGAAQLPAAAGVWLQDLKQRTTEVTHSSGKGREEVEKHIDPSQRFSAWPFLSSPGNMKRNHPGLTAAHHPFGNTPHRWGQGTDGL